ncbi:hypothetical protein ACFQX4_21100 [Roseomonas sp. GCM10028921]
MVEQAAGGEGGIVIPLDELLREAQRLAVNLRGRPEESEALGALQRRLADARRLLLQPAPPAAASAEDSPTAAEAPEDGGLDAAMLESWAAAERSFARQRSGEEAGRRLSFGDLIGEVGHSVAEAQRALDRQSLAYLDDARRLALHGLGMPTAYRLPRVKGAFRFALDTEAEQGFSLFFVRDTETVTSSNTQSVEFEIVAAPAAPVPPEVAAPLALPVLDPGRRATLLAAFRDELSRPEGLPPEYEDQVLFFAFSAPAGEAFLLGLYRYEWRGQPHCALVALLPGRAGGGWQGHLLAEIGEWAHHPRVAPNFTAMEKVQQDLLRRLREG